MSLQRTRARRRDEALTTSDRVAAAFASLLFSVPLMGLLWLLANSAMVGMSDSALPLSYAVAAVIGFTLLALAFPRLAPDVFGWLSEIAVRVARWLW